MRKYLLMVSEVLVIGIIVLIVSTSANSDPFDIILPKQPLKEPPPGAKVIQRKPPTWSAQLSSTEVDVSRRSLLR